jgi:hypothetical protein
LTTSSTNYKVFPTDIFMGQAKKLAKKFPLIKGDFEELQKQLKKDPITGNDSMGQDCYKVRMKITGKPKGQSGGARVIIEVKVVDKKVYVLAVYDKGDQGNIFDAELERCLKKRKKEFPENKKK